MPLKQGSSSATISSNIAELISAGHEPDQAAAIAYKTAGKDSMSQRVSDINGFFEVPRNPLSKVGVFPYTKASVKFPGWENDPNGIIGVYRPQEELSDPETVNSFRLLPWVDDHAMLGSPELDPQLTPPEKKGVHGTLGEQIEFDPDDRTLYGNIKLWSSSLADAIEAGKKELSMGFRCVYEFISGVFEGQPYQAIQRKIRGNHQASVDHGRMGPGVAVLDHLTFALDASELREIKPMAKTTRRAKVSAKLGVAPTALAAAMGMDKVDPAVLAAWNTAMDAEEDGEEDGDGEKGGMTLEEIADMLGEVGPSLSKINDALVAMAGGGAEEPDGDEPVVDDDLEPVVDEFGKPKMGADGKPMMKKKEAAPAVATPAPVADKGLAAMDAALASLKIQSKTFHKTLKGRAVPPALAAMDAAIKTAETNRARIGRRATKPGARSAMDSRVPALIAAVEKLTATDPIKAAMGEIAARDALAKKVSVFTGAFDHSVMTELDVAKYAAGKFGLTVTAEAAVPAVKAYLHNRQPDPVPTVAKSFGMDSAPKPVGKINALLEGKPITKAA